MNDFHFPWKPLASLSHTHKPSSPTIKFNFTYYYFFYSMVNNTPTGIITWWFYSFARTAKQHILIFKYFWKLQVQQNWFLPNPLLDLGLTTLLLPLHMIFSLCAHFSIPDVSFFCYKNPSPIRSDQWITCRTTFTINYLMKAQSPIHPNCGLVSQHAVLGKHNLVHNHD
jgi:hypothetical protein